MALSHKHWHRVTGKRERHPANTSSGWTYISECTHARTRTHTHARTHARTHAHTHARTHALIHLITQNIALYVSSAARYFTCLYFLIHFAFLFSPDSLAPKNGVWLINCDLNSSLNVFLLFIVCFLFIYILPFTLI